MQQTIWQTYRHIIQQRIVQQEMFSWKAFRGECFEGEECVERQRRRQSPAWEITGVIALFSAAAACGVLAQIHIG